MAADLTAWDAFPRNASPAGPSLLSHHGGTHVRARKLRRTGRHGARRQMPLTHALIAVLVAVMGFSALQIARPVTHADASARGIGYSALKWAESHETGAWYCWGGTGPCYDCSGAVMTAFGHSGFTLPRTTEEMLASGRIYQVPARDRRQGDLAFWGNYHVELVTHHGTFGAQQSGTRVGWHRLWGSPTFWRIR